jgi:hypothetical protein
MICNECKCLFVHIPKTAGQSIEQVFIDLLGLSWKKRSKLLLVENKDPLQGPPRLAHLTAQEYITHQYIEPSLFDSYYKFSFVRNPWSRLVSEYKYRYFDLYDFKTFVFNYFPKSNDDHYDLGLDYYRHILPQYDFIYDSSGKQLVDFIGKFENLQIDFELICQQLEIKNITLPYRNKRINYNKNIPRICRKILKNLNVTPKFLMKNSISSSKGKHYTEYYDNETKEFIDSIYDQDIRAFNYQFGV